jgi:hypothetical protein
MAVNDWTAITQGLPAWLDCATADLTSTLSDIVDNAERRIFRELRVPDMETALSVNISSSLAAIPSDFLELKYAYVDSNPPQYLQLVSPAYIYERYPTRSGGGVPVVMARDGSNWLFGPSPDSDYTIKGTYFKALSSIGSGTNNAILTKHPDLYRYACLLETEPVLGRDQRMPLWESKYRMVKELVNGEGDRSRFSGNMQIRPGP